MSIDWRSSQPTDRRVVEPGEHGTYPSPTAPAVEVGGLVVTSGIVGMDADRSVVPGGCRAQTARALEVVDQALGGFGGDLRDVVQLTLHLTSARDIPAASAALDEVFGRPWPPTTMVAVAALATPDLLVEVSCLAAVRRLEPR